MLQIWQGGHIAVAVGGETPYGAVGCVAKLVVGYYLPIVGSADLKVWIGIIAGHVLNVNVVDDVGGRIVGPQRKPVTVWETVDRNPVKDDSGRYKGSSVRRINRLSGIRRSGLRSNDLNIGTAVGASPRDGVGERIVLALIDRQVVWRSACIAESRVAGHVIRVPVFKQKFDVLNAVPAEWSGEHDIMPAPSIICKITLKNLLISSDAGIGVIGCLIETCGSMTGINALIQHLILAGGIAHVKTNPSDICRRG